MVSNDFLEPEERCGFYISKKRKCVWAKELELFEKFIEICDKHNLTYHLAGGSLIGAVRHGGFIPWDDDIDITMMRADYNKFIEAAKNELEEPFFLQTIGIDKGFYRNQIKLRLLNTTALPLHEWKDNLNIHQGIFIDVFPLDTIPEGKIEKFFFWKIERILKIILYNSVFHFSIYDYTLKSKIIYIICKQITNIIPPWKIAQAIDKYVQKYNNKKGYNHIGPISRWSNDENKIRERSWYEETITVKFEGIECTIPKGYNEILNKQYGDWQKPVNAPSEHASLFFDTENSYEKYLGKYDDYKDNKDIFKL